jgi:hypothetical protein
VKRTGNSANAGVTQSLWNMWNPNWMRMSFITDAGDRVAAGCVQRFLHPRHRNIDGRKNEPPPGVPTTRPWWPSAPPLRKPDLAKTRPDRG